jgi:hypothetical protein
MIEVLIWTCCCIRKRERMLRIWRTREYEKKKNEASQEIVHTHTHTHSPALPCVLWQMKFIDAEGAAKLCGKMGEAEQQRWRESSSSSTNWLAHDWGLHRLTGRERDAITSLWVLDALELFPFLLFSFSFLTLFTHTNVRLLLLHILSLTVYIPHTSNGFPIHHRVVFPFSFPDLSVVDKNTLHSIVLFFLL